MSEYDFHFDVRDDGIAILTLDRSESLNSLTFEIYGQLERLFLDLATNEGLMSMSDSAVTSPGGVVTTKLQPGRANSLTTVMTSATRPSEHK